MKRILSPFALIAVIGSLCMISCTEVESLTVNVVDPASRNPEAYAKYLGNLTGYKASDHKVTYAFFDNGVKSPYSPGQHITNLPDSVDFVVASDPVLADFELEDISSVHEKGTKVYFSVSYDDFRADYDAMVKEAEERAEESEGEDDGAQEELPSFPDYLQGRITDALTHGRDFDGLVLEFSGRDPVFLSGTELEEFTQAQETFFGSVSAWRQKNSRKDIVFMGLPQNVIDKTILEDCPHIIIDGIGATALEQVELAVAAAMVEGVPADRFVLAVSTVSLSAADTDTGWWGSSRALSEAAYWVTASGTDYGKAGIAVFDAQNDYYATVGTYSYLRQAIDIMNPSPAK